MGLLSTAGKRSVWGRIMLVAEVALIAKRHLDKLGPGEASELRELLVKSKGRPGNLSSRERRGSRSWSRKLEPGAVREERRDADSRAQGLDAGPYAADVALKRLIPCLDVDDGRVVKGTNFVDIRDAGDPVELAARYDAEGADELVFLDITASHEGRDTIVQLARRTADEVFIPFTIGGGIRSVADAQAVLDAGADKVASTPPRSRARS